MITGWVRLSLSLVVAVAMACSPQQGPSTNTTASSKGSTDDQGSADESSTPASTSGGANTGWTPPPTTTWGGTTTGPGSSTQGSAGTVTSTQGGESVGDDGASSTQADDEAQSDEEAGQICQTQTDCPIGAVCSDGVCTQLPDVCPCPLNSYCDLQTNQCKAGCRVNEHCEEPWVCDPAKNQCVEGCRDHADCPGGSICVDALCAEGCSMDRDCPVGKICTGASCVAGCRLDDDCPESEICDADRCRPGCRNNSDCTATGAICASDFTCGCPDGLDMCAGECVDLQNNIDHCGGCGQRCSDLGGLCDAGECRCPVGRVLCGDSCVDLSSDRDHCGACDRSCGPGTAVFCEGATCKGGDQPETGNYARCWRDSDCFAELGDDAICIHYASYQYGVCADRCPDFDDLSNCDASPGGTAVAGCHEFFDDVGVQWLPYCVLLCGPGMRCPNGMRCSGTPPPYFCISKDD